MEQASATLDVCADLVLSTHDEGGSELETAGHRRQNVDDDDDTARGSMPPNDVDLTRTSYHRNKELYSAALNERCLVKKLSKPVQIK